MSLETKDMNVTALAYIGDAVYEVYIRSYLMERNSVNVDKLHRTAVKYVSAIGQARAIKSLIADVLTEDEIKFVKRARNHRFTSKAKNVDPMTYKYATAFEALVGKMYLEKDMKRLQELVEKSIDIIEN